eukprot:3506490-Pyramimonas_sp.AAC.1
MGLHCDWNAPAVQCERDGNDVRVRCEGNGVAMSSRSNSCHWGSSAFLAQRPYTTTSMPLQWRRSVSAMAL